MEVVLPTAIILAGCMTNNFVLEIIIKEEPGIGNLMTFLQFVGITIAAFFLQFERTPKTLLGISFKKRISPIMVYVFTTLVFFALSVINNKAFDFEISQPVHMVFRSSSLLSNLIFGLFLSKKYTSNQVLGVIFVTVGITVLTLAEGAQKSKSVASSACIGCGNILENVTSAIPSGEVLHNATTAGILEMYTEMMTNPFIRWLCGIGMLTMALFLSSGLGHLQDWQYSKYGKNWQEGMFYTHFLSLPMFLFLMNDIIEHWHRANNSKIMDLGMFQMPSMWCYLALNMFTQIVCILGVYLSTARAGTLTTTLTLTIRKFLSLILSILYFHNPFTQWHWVGSTLVFIGGLVYMDLWKKKKVE